MLLANGKSLFALYILSSLTFLGCDNKNSVEGESQEPVVIDPLFKLLSSEQTNVDFQNTLVEGPNTNILVYEYFYNGGGVATGDLNGDELIDLYFTSNMGNNKLYVNEGNMQFKDATIESGASGRPGPWKTGVTIVDINGDNKLDLYVCYSGALPDHKRANQLFVNQGNDKENNPIFKEQAAEYGVASTGFSNQAYFFDYDLDGDLDVVLLNHNPKSLPILNVENTAQFLKHDDPARGIRLYQQHKGTFTDITTKSGISGSALSYGLGVGITDFNEDGWPDFYVSNDYAVPDYLYINNQDGTFSDNLGKSLGHNSQFSMGNDIGDINNDGKQDIVTLDMLPEDNKRQKLLMAPDNYSKFDLNVRSGFHYQYMRNMLQLNNGNGTFSEIGQMAGISNTDWSWAALLADYNNDGWKDLYITNGYYRDYTNRDFITYMDDYVKSKGRLVRSEVLDIVSHMPSSNLVNYLFSNKKGKSFTNQTKSWGINEPSNSNGAAYADLDNDGDLDLVVNNINQPAFIYQNESQLKNENNSIQAILTGEGMNTQGIGAQVSIYYENKSQTLEQHFSRGYLSAVSPVLHFGIGIHDEVDSIIIRWPSGKYQTLANVKANERLTLIESNAVNKAIAPRLEAQLYKEVSSTINYQSPNINTKDFYRQPLIISEFSFSGPCIVKGDVNSDGLEDVFIGGGKGQSASIYIQIESGKFIELENAAFAEDKESEDSDAVIFDVNNDDNPDIYVASGGYHDFTVKDLRLRDRLYLNDGNGNFTKSVNALPEIFESSGVIAVNDINKDGYLDVFVGSRVVPGRYPETPSSYLLVNDGQGNFKNQIDRIAPELKQIGMVSDATWTDLNSSGHKELIVVGEWFPISVFGIKDGKLTNDTDTYFDKNYSGFWNSIEIGDFNNDQRPDLLVGNIGTNNQFSASDDEPAEMYYKDFDSNGSVDPVFCFYIEGKSYPHLTRDELIKQLPKLGSRFTSYESYSEATLSDIFEESQLEDAEYLRANHTATSLFVSSESGKFELKQLPRETQYSQVNTITILDFNEDGNSDILLCGNNSHTKLSLGKLDANYGVLLEGNGNAEFTYVKQTKSGFDLRGDVRSVIRIDENLLFGINQGPVVSYTLNK